MSLLDFASRRVVLAVGGRRFVCRPPTVYSVFVFLRMFGLQAAALCHAVSEGFTISRKEIIEHFVSDSSRELALAVLETCVECDSASLDDATRTDLGLLRRLADEVASLTDPERIIRATGLDHALDVPAAADGAAPEDHDADAVCYVAAHFGVSPTSVMGWPYLAFLTAGEHMARAAERTREALRERESGPRAPSLADLPMAGILFEKGA